MNDFLNRAVVGFRLITPRANLPEIANASGFTDGPLVTLGARFRFGFAFSNSENTEMKPKIDSIIEKALTNILGCDRDETNKSGTSEALGQNIVVLDRGFVYVGEVTREGDYIVIDGAKNIRVWGTTNGLGELRHGPLSTTILDVCGTVKVPFHALQHLIACKGF